MRNDERRNEFSVEELHTNPENAWGTAAVKRLRIKVQD